MTEPNVSQHLWAAFVLIQQEDKFLLIKESKPDCRNKWFLPGGRAAQDESILQTAIRESKEETGMDVELTGLLYVDQRLVSATTHRGNRIRFVFFGRTVGGAPKEIEDEHSICVAWFSEAEASHLELRSPFILDVLRIRRENPAVLPISRVHVFTREDFLRERP